MNEVTEFICPGNIHYCYPHHRPHHQCATCMDISLSRQFSDAWICHICGGLIRRAGAPIQLRDQVAEDRRRHFEDVEGMRHTKPGIA